MPTDAIVVFSILALIFTLQAVSTVWAMRDAEARGTSKALVASFVLLGAWPVSLFLWLSFRPFKRGEAGRRPRMVPLILAVLVIAAFVYRKQVIRYVLGNSSIRPGLTIDQKAATDRDLAFLQSAVTAIKDPRVPISEKSRLVNDIISIGEFARFELEGLDVYCEANAAYLTADERSLCSQIKQAVYRSKTEAAAQPTAAPDAARR